MKLSAAALLVCACCGEGTQARDDGNDDGFQAVNQKLSALMAHPPRELQQQLADLVARITSDRSDDRLPILLRAARTARVLAYVTGRDEYREQASTLYARATQQLSGPASGPGSDEGRVAEISGSARSERACAVRMEWARFEALDREQPEKAVGIALNAAANSRPGRCRDDAAWLLRVLVPDRQQPTAPSAAERASSSATLEHIVFHDTGENSLRTTIQLDGVVQFRVEEFEQQSGSGVHLRLRAKPGEGVRARYQVERGGLRVLSVVPTQGDELLVSCTLETDVVHHTFFLSDPFRIVFDTSARGPVTTDRRRGVRVVVLDPGHGGEDYGAESEELRESVLALDLAHRAAAYLERWLPESRVLLTRRNDRAVSLEERVSFANRVSADVFVSIHLNGWEEQLSRGGVTTFVLDSTDDEATLELAARENRSTVSKVSAMQRLLAGLVRGEQAPGSRTLASMVHRSVLEMGRSQLAELPDRGVRSAMFYVLVGARMPAILLEASFVTQHAEREALRRGEYRDALAQGIAKGIVEYARRQEGVYVP